MQTPWFGREPALAIQSIGAVLAVLIAFRVPGLNDAVAAALAAVLTALAAAITAAHVRPIAPSVFAALVAPAATLLAAFGYHLSQQQVGTIAGAVLITLALITRAQCPASRTWLKISWLKVGRFGSWVGV